MLSVVTSILAALFLTAKAAPSRRAAQEESWSISSVGTTGVSAMQLAIVSPTLALVLDRAEDNPLLLPDGRPAWVSLFNLETKQITPVSLLTNTFCGSGTFLSNGTLVSIGGNAASGGASGDESGYQALRLFAPCNDPNGVGCESIFEDPDNLHMAAARWYPTSLRIFDGSIMIIAGSVVAGFYDTAAIASANYEFFPPKNGGVPIPSPFLVETLPSNLFPMAFALPDGKIFMVVNNQSMIYDVESNTERRLPPLPNNVRVSYPFSGSGTLLGLSPPDYIPEVLICGGSTVSDALAPTEISSQDPASDQCTRIKLTEEGIAQGWQVEQMPDARIMPETILMPNGEVVIVNGGRTGVSAYAAVPDTPGSGNADDPVFTPTLYSPSASLGSRFSNAQMPTSDIPRLYHSSASLTPNGNVMISGSNPNQGVNTTIEKFPTEYRVEFLDPPFFDSERPSFIDPPTQIEFGDQVTISVELPASLTGELIQVSLMDLGFSTHATHTNQRLVFLVASLSEDRQTLTIQGPPNPRVYPPGPGFVFLTVDGVTSKAFKVMIGSGGDPPLAE